MTLLTFVKLGGSLLTDKRRPESLRRDLLQRLAREVSEAAARLPGALVVGHGSGSFGHVSARDFRIHEGISSTEQLPGVSRTQDLAARLHRHVVAALLEAGALPFSFAPSSALFFSDGRPAGALVEPMVGALGLGLLPVVYGDVVMDRRRGAAICSTELAFERLAAGLAEHGWKVSRVLWLGETDGVYDDQGATLPTITSRREAAAHAGSAAGIDVTGGMRHRLESALRLAQLGATSWILDGRREGIVARALAGEPVPGTRVDAAASRPGDRRVP